MIVLGIHGGVTIRQHEPGAAVALDGKIVAACEEERYLRNKSAYGYLPYFSILACLRVANIRFQDIDLIVSPGVTYGAEFEARLRAYFTHSFGNCPKILLVHHQLSHIAAAFYSSALDKALCVSLDSSGDRACGMLACADRALGFTMVHELPTAESLGAFYTLITYYLGFSDGDEYKVMGLAPYGKPEIDLSKVLDLSGRLWRLDRQFFASNPAPRSPFEPTYSESLFTLLGRKPRVPGHKFEQFHYDLAASAQAVFEQCLVKLFTQLRNDYPKFQAVCFSGGVALNCSANLKLSRLVGAPHLYIPPMPSDRGLACGCAYMGAVSCGDNPAPLDDGYKGESYSNSQILAELKANGCQFREIENPAKAAADMLSNGKIIAWFQGRSEIGARALGNRSILADPRSAAMKDILNARIKYREEFRPFAPSILHDQVSAWYDTVAEFESPYMNCTLPVRPEKSAQIAAAVHVDHSSRVQTVKKKDNQLYYQLISEFFQRTATPAVLNTSFNLKGQPIVESPRDALMTFYGCGLDALFMGNFLLEKSPQF